MEPILSGNIAFTFTLAVFTFIITTVSGNKNYWKHIFWMPGVPVPMKIFLAPIEVIGMFVKPISLMIRLFANITAGHIIVLALMSLIFVFKSSCSSTSFNCIFIVYCCYRNYCYSNTSIYIYGIVCPLFWNGNRRRTSLINLIFIYYEFIINTRSSNYS